MVQTPEQDDGASFADQCVISGSLWVPLSRVANPELVMRAGVVRGRLARTGDIEVGLIRATKTHLVIPRHLNMRVVSPFVQHKRLDYTWTSVDFGDKSTPRDDKQRRAWEALSAADNGTLCVACGGGKSVLGLKKIAQRGYPAIVIVNSEALMQQWTDRALEFLSLAKDDIGYVQGPKEQWDKPLVIAMLQTLATRDSKVPEWVRQRYGTVIFDEVHRTSAATYSRCADMFYGARFGLSATPTRADRLEGVYYAHIGGVIYSDVSSEINATVYVKRTRTTAPASKSFSNPDGTLNISKVYAHLADSKSRNKLLVTDIAAAADAGRRVLVLSHSVEHVSTLATTLAELGRFTVGEITGAVKGAKRLGILRTSQVTVATFTLAKEGLDVPALDTVFLTTPFRDWGAFQQCKGRVERAYAGKAAPIAVLYEDTHISPAAALCAALRREMKARGITFNVVQA